MSKITYASLKLKTGTSVKTFKYNDSEIEVLQYLPIEDKIDLIAITLQKAQEGSIYNPAKKDLYFHLNLIYLYTNITFTDKQREDEAKLYDTLVSNGIMEQVLDNIPESEYEVLYNYIEDLETDILNYKNTFNGALKDIIQKMQVNSEEIQKIMNNFDASKFQEVIDFAKAANGGRDI